MGARSRGCRAMSRIRNGRIGEPRCVFRHAVLACNGARPMFVDIVLRSRLGYVCLDGREIGVCMKDLTCVVVC